MNRDKYKARDRITQKMTRDGVVERNETTGDKTRVSKREASFDIRGDSPRDRGYSLNGSSPGGNVDIRKRYNQSYPQFQYRKETDSTATQGGQIQQDTQPAQINGLVEAIPQKAHPNIADDIPDDQQNQAAPSGIAGNGLNPKSKKGMLKPGKTVPYRHYKKSNLKLEEQNTLLHEPPPESALRQEGNEPALGGSAQSQTNTATQSAEQKTTNQAKNKKARRKSGKNKKTRNKPSSRNNKPDAEPNQNPEPLVDCNVPKASGGKRSSRAPETVRQKKQAGKLKFSQDETAPVGPQSRKLARAERIVERTGENLEKARENLPAKKKLRSERVFNEKTGKTERKLCFEKEVKPQNEHLKGALPLRPVKTGVNVAVASAHRKLFQIEHENVELKAAHRVELITEGGVRTALRTHKTKPYRKVSKLEHKAVKEQANLTYQQVIARDPKQKSNMLSRAYQKRKIKKDYAKQAREAQKTAKRTKEAAKKTKDIAIKTKEAVVKLVKAIAKNPKLFIILLLLGLLLIIILSMCSVTGSLGGGGIGGVVSSSYLAEDADLLGAENTYAAMEADLQYMMENYVSLNPGYDEYRFNVDSIWHDPYVLMAIISAFHDGVWTLAEVQGTLTMLFQRQYTLTETITVEVRTRIETVTLIDPETGDEYEEDVEVSYNYYIITVTLDNFNLSHLPIYIMGETGLSRYALLMMTLGNRPDLFPIYQYPHASVYQDYGRHDIPQEYLDADPTFAAIMAEAVKHLGMPYVWGGILSSHVI